MAKQFLSCSKFNNGHQLTKSFQRGIEEKGKNKSRSCSPTLTPDAMNRSRRRRRKTTKQMRLARTHAHTHTHTPRFSALALHLAPPTRRFRKKRKRNEGRVNEESDDYEEGGSGSSSSSGGVHSRRQSIHTGTAPPHPVDTFVYVWLGQKYELHHPTLFYSLVNNLNNRHCVMTSFVVPHGVPNRKQNPVRLHAGHHINPCTTIRAGLGKAETLHVPLSSFWPPPAN